MQQPQRAEKAKSAFYYFACLDCLDRNPHPLDLTARQLDPYPLQVRFEPSLVDFDELQANAAGFFANALAYDATADSWPFSCNCANSRHGK
jgi:hypothetical protein